MNNGIVHVLDVGLQMIEPQDERFRTSEVDEITGGACSKPFLKSWTECTSWLYVWFVAQLGRLPVVGCSSGDSSAIHFRNLLQ